MHTHENHSKELKSKQNQEKKLRKKTLQNDEDLLLC